MFAGNRGNFIALGIVAFVAITLGVLLYINASTLQAQYERSAYQGAKGYTDRAAIDLKRCAAEPVARRMQCKAEASERAREGKRNEYDLEAQRITAVWTAHMGAAAMIGMIASIIGVGLVWTTFRETKSSNELFRTKERAIINTKATIVFQTYERIEFGISAENIGQTAALNVNVRCRIDDNPPSLENLEQSQIVYTIEPGKHQDLILNEIDADRIGSVTVYGMIVYDTLFERGKATPFAYVVRPAAQHASIPSRGPLVAIPCVPREWPLAT